MATKGSKRKPSTLAEWKEEQALTDDAIAQRIRARGVEVKRAMISHIVSGRRTAGGRLALALSEETGLPVETFLRPAALRAA